jgi:hypothetical protein
VEITSHCPKCQAAARFDSSSAPAEVACPGCGARRAVTIGESVLGRNTVDRCVLCGCGHLYIEKDFNSWVGGAVVVLAIVASGIAWARNVLVSIGILAGAAVLDLAVWLVARERTRCYRCETVYRGGAPNPAHERYELGLAGRFASDYDEQRELHQK